MQPSAGVSMALTGRPRCKSVCVCCKRGEKVLLCVKIYLSLGLNVSHMRLPLSISSFFFSPSRLQKELPSQNTSNRIKLVCTLVVVLTDQRQTSCFNLSSYAATCVFQRFFLFMVLATDGEHLGDFWCKLN